MSGGGRAVKAQVINLFVRIGRYVLQVVDECLTPFDTYCDVLRLLLSTTLHSRCNFDNLIRNSLFSICFAFQFLSGSR